MKVAITHKAFRRKSLAIIEAANEVIGEYQQQGYMLTLRQLYYQFVARELLPNQQKAYKNLGNVIADARMAGLIDWSAIEDRTRYLRRFDHWSSSAELLDDATRWFTTDKWADQERYVEVWIEKDALLGVIEGSCTELQVPYFACRGYPSLSEMWEAAQRVVARRDGAAGRRQSTVILHLGDHDPSGIDMTRDIQDRLSELSGVDADIRRIALNSDQVDEHRLPPNPAKLTDTRADDYIAKFGSKSWELDALEPQIIAQLVEQHILALRDESTWRASLAREDAMRDELNLAKANLLR